MRFAILTLLAMASATTSVALAQDGAGSGPPKKTSIVFAAKAQAAPSAITKLFQPVSELRTMMK